MIRCIIGWIRSITMFDIIQFLFACVIAFGIVSLLSCSSIQTGGETKAASYHQSYTEIQDILKHSDNLTPEQKVILKHAAADLKDAQTQSKQIAKLQTQIVKSSEKAGAGKLIYNIMYFVAFLVAAFLGFKIMKKFSIF